LVIEVTERFGGCMASVVKSLRRLRAASLRLALDDIGAGNSGLEMLSSAAIGVVYRPQGRTPEPLVRRQRERQFDALVHIDHTRAVEPFERAQAWALGEPPETYPTAL
jgi:EAL domain-containing protein (putative c-di-GMP-specific phosphodiesterase class I)